MVLRTVISEGLVFSRTSCKAFLSMFWNDGTVFEYRTCTSLVLLRHRSGTFPLLVTYLCCSVIRTVRFSRVFFFWRVFDIFIYRIPPHSDITFTIREQTFPPPTPETFWRAPKYQSGSPVFLEIVYSCPGKECLYASLRYRASAELDRIEFWLISISRTFF